MTSLRMWALSQVLSVGCGLVGRKAQACLESGWSLRMHCAGSGGGGHVGCQETQRRPARFLVLEGCVLSAVGLQASSLCCFLLLMRVPSGLLRVSWPGPRKEMMQLAPHLPGCALIRNTKREDVLERPPFVWKHTPRLRVLLDGHPHVCPGGSVWGQGPRVLCQVVVVTAQTGCTYLCSLQTHSTLTPQDFSFVASFWQKR